MPDIKTKMIYTLQLEEKEFKIITRALAFLGGIAQREPEDDQKIEANQLNERILKVQSADLREKLRLLSVKEEKAAAVAEDRGNR